ncbi:hypothetical protein B4U79_14044, partial [Dinothrombium tinctorium]
MWCTQSWYEVSLLTIHKCFKRSGFNIDVEEDGEELLNELFSSVDQYDVFENCTFEDFISFDDLVVCEETSDNFVEEIKQRLQAKEKSQQCNSDDFELEELEPKETQND